MSMLHTIRYIWNHPLNAGKKLNALSRFVRWQVGSRLVRGAVAVNFVDSSRLLIAAGMHGATMSIYTGLQEFEDMAFVLHFLNETDMFVDVGANVGTYTVLSSGAVGARTISIEPVPSTYASLIDNIRLNDISEKVNALNTALGRETGELSFTAGLGTVNHVLSDKEVCENVIRVPVNTLDNILTGHSPTLMKIDVEGYETIVLAGGHGVLANESLLGVIMELNGSGERYGYSEEALHELMLGYGFNTYSYAPFERKLIPLQGKNAHTGNTLYLRRTAEVMARIESAKRFEIHQSGGSI